MKEFADIYSRSLNRAGEELCGDQIRISRGHHKTRIVLSDGLGSGVKASILATLTAQIVITMLLHDVSLDDVIETVIATLPVCQVRRIAYATFTIVEIDESSYAFKIINFDNPPPIYLKRGQLAQLDQREETISGKQVTVAEGNLEIGDLLTVMSDGVWHAGLGKVFNFGWGWDNIAAYLGHSYLEGGRGAKFLVEQVLRRTEELYGEQPGDDASMVGIYMRPRRSALVFTGPPIHRKDDVKYARRLLDFDGRHIVCGGTTGEIVARVSGSEIEVDKSTMTREIPPIARLDGVELMTEGVLTLNKAAEIIEAAGGQLENVPRAKNGAVLLARELLRADDISFLVGLQPNPFYQNPLLPEAISIRKTLVERLSTQLKALHKEVFIEYC